MSQEPLDVRDHHGLSFLLDLRRLLVSAGLPEDRAPHEHEMELIAERNRATPDGSGVLVGLRGGRVVGYAPYLLRTRHVPIRLGEKVFGRVRFRAVQLLRPNSSQWGEAPTCEEILIYLARSQPGVAVCASEIDTAGPLWEAIGRVGRRHYLVSQSAPFVHMFHLFANSYDAFLSGRSKKTRAQFRNSRNRLKKIAGDGLALDEYTDAGDVARFLAAANEISARTYQARLFGEVVECTAESKHLYDRYARCGLFRSYILRAGLTPIAFLLAYGEPDGTHVWATEGYDPDWREGSPGTNCALMVVERLYELGTFAKIDFGGGYSEQKRFLGNHERMAVNPMLLPKTLKGASLLAVETIVEGGNRHAVALMAKTRLRARIKQWLRR